jgi:hypothetical protein
MGSCIPVLPPSRGRACRQARLVAAGDDCLGDRPDHGRPAAGEAAALD